MQPEDLLRSVAQRHGLQVTVPDVALRDEELRRLVVRVVHFQVVCSVSASSINRLLTLQVFDGKRSAFCLISSCSVVLHIETVYS